MSDVEKKPSQKLKKQDNNQYAGSCRTTLRFAVASAVRGYASKYFNANPRKFDVYKVLLSN